MLKPESYYSANAKPGCQECNGKGMVMDYHSQDRATLEPCSTCFPDDERVRSLKASKAEYEILNTKRGTVIVLVP